MFWHKLNSLYFFFFNIFSQEKKCVCGHSDSELIGQEAKVMYHSASLQFLSSEEEAGFDFLSLRLNAEQSVLKRSLGCMCLWKWGCLIVVITNIQLLPISNSHAAEISLDDLD